MRPLALLFVSMTCVPLGAQGPGGGPPQPQPLPPRPVPAQNPITPAKALLGKVLFWEEQLSSDNRVACGTCHTFAAGGGDVRRVRQPGNDGVLPSPDDVWGSPGIRRSDAGNAYRPDATFGFERQVTDRASPSFLTAAWFQELFWDGRAASSFADPEGGNVLIPAGGALENQAIAPLLSDVEMAHDLRTLAQLTGKLAISRPLALAANLPSDMAQAVAGGTTYPDLFQSAFGTPDVTAARIAMALATYQRTLVPDQTPYDRFVGGDPTALTPAQQNGLNVFLGPGRCGICHTSGLFSDGQFHNLGLRPIGEDAGRAAVTGNLADGGRFKTPSLRNVGLRSSFMHNGQFTSLQQVFGFYLNGGGPFLANKDPQLLPLQVGPQAAGDLIDFVQNGLTDPRVAAGQAPFDRPLLRSQLLPSAGNLYGLPTAGTGGLVPSMLAEVPANLGNPDFKVGVHRALGGAPTLLALSLQPVPGGVAGTPLLIGPAGLLVLPGTLHGSAGVAGAGYGTLRVAVPDAPALVGLSLFAQWLVSDPGVAGGFAASRGARIDLF